MSSADTGQLLDDEAPVMRAGRAAAAVSPEFSGRRRARRFVSVHLRGCAPHVPARSSSSIFTSSKVVQVENSSVVVRLTVLAVGGGVGPLFFVASLFTYTASCRRHGW